MFAVTPLLVYGFIVILRAGCGFAAGIPFDARIINDKSAIYKKFCNLVFGEKKVRKINSMRTTQANDFRKQKAAKKRTISKT